MTDEWGGRLPPVARSTDPETSHIAERLITSRRPSQMLRLLAAYGTQPLTDEEASIITGVRHQSATKRCADLRNGGLIEPTGDTALGSARMPQRICRITDEGRRVLAVKRERGSP